jgi:hypothetical protein
MGCGGAESNRGLSASSSIRALCYRRVRYATVGIRVPQGSSASLVGFDVGEDDEGKYAVTSIRSLGALAIPLAVGVVAFGPGAQAQAAGSAIKSPAANAVITSGSTTRVAAHLDLLVTGDLYVRGPGGDRKIGGGVGPKDISGSVGIGRNGAYVVTLKGLLGTIDQRTFYVRVPPARPSGVQASISDHKLVVRWERGTEPDLTGYDVLVGGARQRQGSLGALCSGEVCSTALSLPASGRADVGVRARRSTGTGGTVSSGSATTSVVVPGSPTEFAGGGGPAALPSQTSNPLLPLPGRSPLSLPTVAPDGAVPGFQYPTPGPQVADPAVGPAAEKAASTGRFRGVKSVALALILLVVAAHLGAWTRRLRLAQGAESASAGVRRASGGDGPPEPKAGGTSAPARRADEPGADRPATGRLIDAKGTVVDAALLRRPESPRPSAATPPSASVMAATAAAAAQDGKARSRRSPARRSPAYRGRRRAD